MTTTNKHKRKKRKNPATNAVVYLPNKKRRKHNPANPSNPFGGMSFSLSNVFDTLIDGGLAAGAGVVTRKLPDWIGIENKWVRYAAMLGVVVIGSTFGHTRIGRTTALGASTALVLAMLEEFFPAAFGKKGFFAPTYRPLPQLSQIQVTPQGQMLLKGQDESGQETEVPLGQLTPEELQQYLVPQQGLSGEDIELYGSRWRRQQERQGNIVITPRSPASDTGSRTPTPTVSGDDIELLGEDEEVEMQGVDEYYYRDRANQQFNYGY